MTNECNAVITPGKEYSDDLKKSNLVVGTKYKYCVSAVATECMAQLPDSAGNLRPFIKASVVTCTDHMVQWVSN